MKSKLARWGFSHLLAVLMIVVAGSAFAAGESLMHNSNNLGTKYGAWGVAGGKYGEFTCTTCHSTATAGTNNVKRIKGTITAPQGNWSSSKAATVSVVFNNMTAFGNDTGGHVTSTRICEVCHSKTTVHKYNTTGQSDLEHKGANLTDCTSCHSHADAFKGKGCTSCHGASATSGNPIITGKHTAHINNSSILGANYGCVDCHAKSVTGDEDIKSAPTAHQNGTFGDFSGVRAGNDYAAGNCSTAYCHTDGKGGAPAVAVNWATGPALDCKGCHGGGLSQAGEPVDSTHPTHVAKTGVAASCQNCHGDTMSGTALNASGKHTDRSVDVAAGNGKVFTFNAGTCSAVSCHSNGFFTPADAQWGATLDCAGCHATTGLTSGDHNKHLSASIATSFNCGNCHADTATNNTTLKAEPNSHMNSAKNVVFDANNASGSFAGGSCTNLYCHSYGTTTAGPFKVKTTPVWGVTTINNCYSCHGGDSTTGLLNNMSTGRHKKHMMGQYTYSCGTCHATTASGNTSIADQSKHVNVQIDVSFSGIATTGGAPASYTNSGHAPGQPGTINDSCQNIYCHSNAQVQPGHANLQFRNLTGNKRFSLSTAAGLGCTGCHGSTTTAGQFQLSGKHLAHTNTAVGRIVDCYLCHINGGTTNNRINHANGLVNYSSQLSGRVTVADGKCSNVYCHSNAKGTFVNMSNANWFSSRTLDCKGCHGGASSQAGEPNYASGAAGSATANNHPQHVGTTGANATCQNCHRKTVTGVLLNRSTHTVSLAGSNRSLSYHADQNMSDASAGVYAGNGKTFTYTAGTKTCSNISCHSGNGLVAGVADAQWGGSFTCESCHGGNASATNKITSGQHGKHTNQVGVLGVNFGCVECHAQTVSSDTTLKVGNTTHMNALANFSGAKAGKNSASCSTAYCHSDGKGGAGATTVSWSTGPVLDCKGCHGGASSQAGEPFYLSTAPGTLKTNTHPKHVGTIGADATCQNCHGNTMSGTGLNASGNHLNGGINVIQGNGKTFTYSNDSTKTCSNISCHSGGGMFTAADVQWGATMPADCTGCHGNESSATLSGAHNAHLNSASTGGSFKCKDCHAPTITNADNRTITTVSNHGNTLVNFSGARAGKNANCSNIYCHSNGKGAFAAIPAWTSGTNLNCNGCHAQGALSANYAHAPHLAKGATCSQCHSATTTTDSTITGSLHIDGSVNLQQGGTFATKAVSFVPAGGGTCNNISCHSPAATGPYSNSATWGVAATCETCHPKAGLSGNHSVHMGALDLTSSAILYNMTANRTPVQNDSVKTHGFGCANCHPMTATNHLNGSIDVSMTGGQAGMSSLRFLNSTTAANLPVYSGGKCNNIYCHSNASRVASENVYKQSPTWVGGSFTGDRCAGCHDNQPATGAHAAHAVGNHYENIFTGKSGKVATSNRANSAHGNPNNSTTIGCYICHNTTVTSKANDNNTKCVGCHYTGNSVGAQLKGAATIANLKNHVNGAREIAFLPIQVKSKAQIRPESFKFYSGVWQRTSYKNMSTLSYDTAKLALDTASMWHPSTPMASNCTNIACHNGKTVSWNLANWNDPNKCMDCHNQL